MKLQRIIAREWSVGGGQSSSRAWRTVYTLENSKEDGGGRDENGIQMFVG
jgi:hypothetical protein